MSRPALLIECICRNGLITSSRDNQAGITSKLKLTQTLPVKENRVGNGAKGNLCTVDATVLYRVPTGTSELSDRSVVQFGDVGRRWGFFFEF